MDKPKDDAGSNSTTALLKSVGNTVWPLLLAGGGLISFVALAGSAIVWTRFSAAGVPPDQVVAIYPRGELVAIASALLLIFGLVGILAAGFCYLLDLKGRATVGMTRGLLTIFGVEGLGVMLVIVHAPSQSRKEIATSVFLACIIGIFWTTVLYVDPTKFKLKEGVPERLPSIRRRFFALAMCTLLVAAVAAAVVANKWGLSTHQALIGLACVVAVPTVYGLLQFRGGIGATSEEKKQRAKEKKKAEEEEEAEKFSVPFTRPGMWWIAGLIVVAIGAPPFWLDSLWLLASLAGAALLFVGLWRAAVVPKNGFLWFGFAVFVSVPLFGTVTWMAQNAAEPQVQPMALIRKTDDVDEYLQGLFVAETDNRVYFADVASEGCNNKLVHDSGKLLWVPKAEIAAISVGPLQSVDRAREAALEMSYALAPEAAEGTGDGPVLTVAEPSSTADAAPAPRRLGSTGAAVEPDFGAGLRLVPATAEPGEVVTLKMTSPMRKVQGFGRRREHRTLRIGGVPAEIAIEQAQSPWDAEYVATSQGKIVKLAKGKVYTRSGDRYLPITRDEARGRTEPLYVKVDDPSVVAIHDLKLAREGSRYLRIAVSTEKKVPVEVAAKGMPGEAGAEEGYPAVLIHGSASAVRLKAPLFRQDWHEDHIKFRVPERATSGAVTIECHQLNDSPLLHVDRPPQAKIAVRILPGSDRIRLDGSRSFGETGKIVSWRWSEQGLYLGRGPRLVEKLRAQPQPYSIDLTVRNENGVAGTAELKVFHLRDESLKFGKRAALIDAAGLAPVRRSVHRATATGAAESIVLEGGALKDGAPIPTGVDNVRHELLNTSSKQLSDVAVAAGGLTIHTLAFGKGCPPLSKNPGRHFDILILGPGVQVVPSHSCPPLRSQTTHQLLAPG
jgi:hypothetical protein